MECFICRDNLQEKLLPTLCGCNDLYVHLSCIKKFDASKVYCTVCKRRFNGELFYKLKKHNNHNERTVRPLESVDPVEPIGLVGPVAISNRYRKIILGVSFTISLLGYIGLACFFVSKYYIIPNKIKNNQTLSICTAVDIEYTLYNSSIINGTLREEFSVVHARDEKNRKITKLFNEYTCTTPCPKIIRLPCWKYKNYIAKEKTDVEELFAKRFYIEWFAYGAGISGLAFIYIAFFQIKICGCIARRTRE